MADWEDRLKAAALTIVLSGCMAGLLLIIFGSIDVAPEVAQQSWPEAICAVQRITKYADQCCRYCANVRILAPKCNCNGVASTCYVTEIEVGYNVSGNVWRQGIVRFPRDLKTGVDAQEALDLYTPDLGKSIPCWYESVEAPTAGTNTTVIFDKSYTTKALAEFISALVLLFLFCFLPVVIGFICCVRSGTLAECCGCSTENGTDGLPFERRKANDARFEALRKRNLELIDEEARRAPKRIEMQHYPSANESDLPTYDAAVSGQI